MSRRSYAARFLAAIEKKYKAYFATNHLKIMDCVFINPARPATIHVISSILDPDIRFEIETMFWKD